MKYLAAEYFWLKAFNSLFSSNISSYSHFFAILSFSFPPVSQALFFLFFPEEHPVILSSLFLPIFLSVYLYLSLNQFFSFLIYLKNQRSFFLRCFFQYFYILRIKYGFKDYNLFFYQCHIDLLLTCFSLILFRKSEKQER